jgi:hypothetical protein
VGLIINANFAQMIDFAAGFMGLDPAGDDGRKYGLWPSEIPGWPCPSGEAAPGEKPATPPKKTEKQASGARDTSSLRAQP